MCVCIACCEWRLVMQIKSNPVNIDSVSGVKVHGKIRIFSRFFVVVDFFSFSNLRSICIIKANVKSHNAVIYYHQSDKYEEKNVEKSSDEVYRMCRFNTWHYSESIKWKLLAFLSRRVRLSMGSTLGWVQCIVVWEKPVFSIAKMSDTTHDFRQDV